MTDPVKTISNVEASMAVGRKFVCNVFALLVNSDKRRSHGYNLQCCFAARKFSSQRARVSRHIPQSTAHGLSVTCVSEVTQSVIIFAPGKCSQRSQIELTPPGFPNHSIVSFDIDVLAVVGGDCTDKLSFFELTERQAFRALQRCYFGFCGGSIKIV